MPKYAHQLRFLGIGLLVVLLDNHRHEVCFGRKLVGWAHFMVGGFCHVELVLLLHAYLLQHIRLVGVRVVSNLHRSRDRTISTGSRFGYTINLLHERDRPFFFCCILFFVFLFFLCQSFEPILFFEFLK